MSNVEVTVRKDNVNVVLGENQATIAGGNKRTINVDLIGKINTHLGIIKSQVVSVAGKTGIVTLEPSDIIGLEEFLEGFADKNFVYDQIVASSSWEITHNLGKLPSVTIIDSGGTQIMGDVSHFSINKLFVFFSSPFSGTAFLN